MIAIDPIRGMPVDTEKAKFKAEVNRLLLISDLIDWFPIRKILEDMYDNKS